jgi:hypothetical protein
MNLLDLMLNNFICLGNSGTHTHKSTASLNYLHEVIVSPADLGNDNYGDQMFPQVNTTLRIVLKIPFYNIAHHLVASCLFSDWYSKYIFR